MRAEVEWWRRPSATWQRWPACRRPRCHGHCTAIGRSPRRPGVKVEQAAAAARATRSRPTASDRARVAVVMPYIDRWYFAQVLDGVERAFAGKGHRGADPSPARPRRPAPGAAGRHPPARGRRGAARQRPPGPGRGRAAGRAADPAGPAGRGAARRAQRRDRRRGRRPLGHEPPARPRPPPPRAWSRAGPSSASRSPPRPSASAGFLLALKEAGVALGPEPRGHRRLLRARRPPGGA